MEEFKVKYFVKGDMNGYFGLFTNNLTNILVMAGLLSSAVGLPNKIVYGRIIPAVGFSIMLSSIYYSYMAYKLAKREKRNTVTSLPSGTSVPHMFLIVFMVIGPTFWATNDPYLAWYAGLAWSFIEGIIELLGSFIGEKARKVIPRAAMLGSLAGVSITYIAMNPALKIWQVPYIGFASLSIIIIGWLGKDKMPLNLPTGLIAILLGTLLGWIGGSMSSSELTMAINQAEISFPRFSIMNVMKGMREAAPFLAAAVPFGIYNFFETMDNVESASVAGDEYSTRETLIADGATSIIGSFMGNPFPTAVFIGHPGWKETGGRIGYTLMTGLSLILITNLGLVSILLKVVPLEAILPILLYIGIIISNQAFSSVKKKYYPAVIFAFIPWIADWSRNNIDIALSVANQTAEKLSYQAFSQAGLDYAGMKALGAGAIVVGMLWAMIVKYVIDMSYMKAAYTSLVACLLSYIGVIHSSQILFGIGKEIALGYLMMTIIFIVFEKMKGMRKNEKI